jgi:hypothetical protein
LSIEAVLLFTVIGIGLMVGLVVLRDALIRKYASDQEARFIVADSSGDSTTTPAIPSKLVGIAVGFDEKESPLLVFTDYDPLGTGINFRALIGARADRFTSRQVVLYESTDCGATASLPICVTKPGAFDADDLIKSATGLTSSLSSIYALQGNGPVYAVGRGITSSDQGRLYRGNFTSGTSPQQVDCPANEFNSVWVSMRGTNDSCLSLVAPITGTITTDFQEAVEVMMPDGVTNVFFGLTPPFFTNMVGNPLTDFSSTAPTAETP